jgi:hypothetical protein
MIAIETEKRITKFLSDNPDVETPFGLWRLDQEYTHVNRRHDSNKLELLLRYKWFHPMEPDNRATPERTLHLCVYGENTHFDDFLPRLQNAIAFKLEDDQEKCFFSYDDGMLRKMHDDEPF